MSQFRSSQLSFLITLRRLSLRVVTSSGPVGKRVPWEPARFALVKFDPGVRLELERNRTYWRSGYPRSERLIFSFGVSPAEILAQFRAGRFSLASDLLPARCRGSAPRA